MHYKVYSMKDVEKLLRKNGYLIERKSGSHLIYFNEQENRHITIVGGHDMNPMIIRRLIKEYSLNE